MAELVHYLGCRVIVTDTGFRVRTPDGDTGNFPSMKQARLWIRRHRRMLRGLA